FRSPALHVPGRVGRRSLYRRERLVVGPDRCPVCRRRPRRLGVRPPRRRPVPGEVTTNVRLLISPRDSIAAPARQRTAIAGTRFAASTSTMTLKPVRSVAALLLLAAADLTLRGRVSGAERFDPKTASFALAFHGEMSAYRDVAVIAAPRA